VNASQADKEQADVNASQADTEQADENASQADKEQADVNASQANGGSIYEEAREATLGRAGTSRDSIMLPLPSERVSLCEGFVSVDGQDKLGMALVWHSHDLFFRSGLPIVNQISSWLHVPCGNVVRPSSFSTQQMRRQKGAPRILCRQHAPLFGLDFENEHSFVGHKNCRRPIELGELSDWHQTPEGCMMG
jgi:hypothetical protein